MPFDPDCYHAALAHYMSGRIADALALLEPSIDGGPASPETLDLAAACEYSMNRPDRAEAYWRRAIGENPHHARAHSNLGNLYERLGRLPKAEAMYRRALELKSDFAEAHYNLGRLLMSQKRFDEAKTHLQLAVEARPDWADAHFKLGNVLAAQLHRDEAERAYRAAIELNPRLITAYQGLAELLESRGDLAELENVYHRLAESMPDLAAAHYNLGQVIYRTTAVAGLERLDEAEAAYRRAIALQQDYTQAYIALGNLLKEHPTRVDDMLATFRRAVEIDNPHHAADARLNLAGGLLRVGANAEAWPLLEASLRCQLAGAAHPRS